jgi:Icc-related predicted phosphoesterase
MRIVCISDNHDQNLSTKFAIPEGDVLVHVGDGSAVGNKFDRFIRVGKNIGKVSKNFKEVLYVPGNHDHLAWSEPDEVRRALAGFGIRTLFDEGVRVGGVTFWGSGWLQPKIGFSGEYGGNFSELWDKCPAGVDVLLTHQPPYSIMDFSKVLSNQNIGSTVIYWEVFRRIRPRFHVFGHNHSGHGVREIDGITFVNAALCNDQNQPAYEPIVIEVDVSKERP